MIKGGLLITETEISKFTENFIYRNNYEYHEIKRFLFMLIAIKRKLNQYHASK